MINKIIIISFSFLLTGCGFCHPVIPESDASVFFINDTVCLTTPGRTEIQMLKGITISIHGERGGFKKYFQEGDYRVLSKDGCIPTYGFNFATGSAYHATIYLTEDNSIKDDSRHTDAYYVSFIIWETSSKVKNIEILNSDSRHAFTNNLKSKGIR